jgi:hypothetical protein
LIDLISIDAVASDVNGGLVFNQWGIDLDIVVPLTE